MRSPCLQFGSLLFWILLLCWELDPCASLDAQGGALMSFRAGVELDPYSALAGWGEGNGIDPCFWFGVGCSDDGSVVSLNLKDLCLRGMLAPDLGKLVYMKSLVLHNNSFSGIVPREIGELQRLEILDLGHNNLGGSLPPELGNILSLEILILDNNKFIATRSQELHVLNTLPELLIDEVLLSSNQGSVRRGIENGTIRRLLQLGLEEKARHKRNGTKQTSAPSLPAPTPTSSPSPSPSPSQSVPNPSPSPSPIIEPLSSVPAAAPPSSSVLFPSPYESPYPSVATNVEVNHTNHYWKIYGSVASAVSFLLALTAVYFLCCRSSKVVTVRPWVTGLSGQLQKAFVTGVPSLKRSELQTACEDFSNIIGSSSDCKLYKGTLSSGVEIAVISSGITSVKDWSKHSESEFRKKISMLSKVNHKNFVNLLGYCEEAEPFTRMMVFEYAPNGTLFEHLHIKEAEPLDWAARLRIAMGVAYCLEHMHRLDPPVILQNLDSSSIHLTDDYAAKISDLRFWDATKEPEPPLGINAPLPDSKSIVHKFGMLLLELLSGSSKDENLIEHWASSYLTGRRPLEAIIDPTLKSLHDEGAVIALCEVIQSCINPGLKERPTMAEVACRLRSITAMTPEGATPKLSPLWWAELEILSSGS